MPRFSRGTSPAGPPDWNSELYATAASRAKRRETTELFNWSEVALNSMGAALTEYSREGDADRLRDLRIAMISMWALLTELTVRAESDKELRD